MYLQLLSQRSAGLNLAKVENTNNHFGTEGVICIVPLIPAVMMLSGSIVHPSWVGNGCSVAYVMWFMVVASTGEYVITVEKITYLHFKVWARGKGWFGH